MLQLAIDKAEEGDTSVLEQVMDAVTQPYGPPGGASRPPVVIVDSPEGKRELRMDRGPPEAYRHVKLTCSS